MQPFTAFYGIISDKSQEDIHMNRWETDFLNLENELLSTRKKLNDLIYEYQNKGQNTREDAIYQDKLHYLEVEMQYINNQLQLLKSAQNASPAPSEPVTFQNVQNPAMQNPMVQEPVMQNSVAQDPIMQNPTMPYPMAQDPGMQNPAAQSSTMPNPVPNVQVQNQQAPNSKKEMPYPTASYAKRGRNAAPAFPTTPAAPVKSMRTTQDYEKLFGKNLMGIFASVLIFISLIIFATLILPHLTDTLKMLAMYIASAAVLTAGLLLYRKNKENLFYIAIIGCGIGSLYLSLLLSNMYFKVLGDLLLYILILIWAVFVKYLTRIKNLVFNIIGQIGILIASILGTILCVTESDPQKFLVLSIFYFISAVVFSNIGRTYLRSLLHSGQNGVTEEGGEALKPIYYESNLCTHICKTLNVIVYTIGLIQLTNSINAPIYTHCWDVKPYSAVLLIITALLFMGYLLLEYFFSYKEQCKGGIAFQVLTMINLALLAFLFNEMELGPKDWTFAFLYLISIAALFYVEKKDADCRLFSQVWCFAFIFTACTGNTWINNHLYAYLTIVPCMLYGKWKKDKPYLAAGVVYLAGLPLFAWSSYHINPIESLIMLVVLYGVFLYVGRKTDQTWFKMAGYIVISFIVMRLVYDISRDIMESFTGFKEMAYHDPNTSELKANLNEMIRTYSSMITFYVLAVIHLILSKLEFFGKDKVTVKVRLGMVEGIMLGFNALLMFTGCVLMYETDEMFLKLPLILITILLFFINSKNLLLKHKHAGYYIALKYTTLMLCILGSYDVVDYATSICLLVFAIISIVTGFYKDTIAFRLYGLILSMISIVKLIMFDIKYDSTIENAISFFVSGVLCFVISFIYNRIDGKLRGK